MLTNGRDFVTGLPAGPDGLTIDPSGNLYASLTTRVRAWSPAGTQLMDLPIPQSSTNVEIGGPTGKTLFVTAGTGVYGIDLNIAPIAASWNVNSNGSWSSAANWAGGIAPNGVDHVATFGSAISAPRTINVNFARTVGAIHFNDADSYSLGGSGTITLDVGSGAASINVISGSHAITAPLVLNDNLTVTVTPAASTLTLSGNLSATGKTLTKAGNGTAQVENLRAASLNITAGTLRVSAKGTPNSASGTSVLTSTTIAASAKLDLTNNSLILDHSGPVGALVEETRQRLLDGRLISSLASATQALGYADNASLGRASFAGQDVDASSLLVKFTYRGDCDLDGDVDIADLYRLASSWQAAGVWSQGDFDYSGTIDTSDLSLLATNWQAGVGSPLGADFSAAVARIGFDLAVPEPSSVFTCSIASVSLLRRRRRRFS